MVCNDIKLDVAIGAKLDGMELLKGQTKKLRMLRMIQGGSQEHGPEQAQRRKQEYTNNGQGDALGSVTKDGLMA